MHGHRDDNKVILHGEQQGGMLNITPSLNDLSKTLHCRCGEEWGGSVPKSSPVTHLMTVSNDGEAKLSHDIIGETLSGWQS